MPLSTNAMIAELRTNLGVDSSDPGFDDTGCLLLLNLEWWSLIDTFHFREKESTFPITTVAGTISYAVPQPFEATRYISIEDPNDFSHTPLDYMDPVVYESVFVNDSDEWAKPTNYVRINNMMNLWPTPDDVYNLTLYYWTTLSDLSAGTTMPIPQVWSECIVYGATGRGYVRLGDLSKAASMMQFRDAALARINPTQGKEETDTRYAALAVRRNDRQ